MTMKETFGKRYKNKLLQLLTITNTSWKITITANIISNLYGFCPLEIYILCTNNKRNINNLNAITNSFTSLIF